MSELIARLRSLADLDSKREAMADTLHDAADEIARLRWQIVELRGKRAEIADERDELRRQLAEAGKSIARQAATIRGLTRPAEE